MIPTIGLMVGFYIVTRMISLATRKGDRAESDLVRVLAVITVLVAVWGMATLLTSSGQLIRGLG